ncbi:RNA-directed DNA polymerase, eukaryota [Tanacetum coccineum]
MGSKRTKEDDGLKISTSVFVTNFREQASAKDLWNACKQYEHVVDAFIPNKRSKVGKRFFEHRIHANAARFHRPKGSTSSHQPAMKGKIKDSSIGNTKDNGHRDDVSSYANVVKNQSQWNGENDSKPVLVLDDSCVNTQDYSCCLNGKVNEVGVLENLKVALGNEGFTDIDLRYMGGFHRDPGWTPRLDDQNDEESDSENEECEEVFKKDFGESDEEVQWENDVSRVSDIEVEEEDPKSKDGVVSSEQNGEASTKESLEYPPGFTPRENDVENVEMDNQKDNCDGEFRNVNNISDEVNFSSGFNTYKKAGGESMDSDHCRESEGSRKGGSILMLMDELVKVGQTMRVDGVSDGMLLSLNIQGLNPKAKKDWVKELCVSNKVNFLTLQETKMESIDLFEIKRCWGNFAFDYVHSASVGKSGGILCVWDPNAFKKLNSTASDYFVMIQGNWVSNGKLLLIISVAYRGEFMSVIISEDLKTIFNVHGANAFNSFISMENLEEVLLGGCSFSWCHRSASKMSKLDRFLMSESLLSECPNLSAITLDRFLSDHRPILLRESTHDYGPIPF